MTTVRVPELLRPKKPRWMAWTTAFGALSVLTFAVAASMRPWQPGRVGGLVFGTAAAVLFVNAGLYPLRRTLRAWPLGTVQRWLQLHVYGATLAMLFVVLHMGVRWPSGQMGWWLFGLSLWTTATGYLGVLLQKRLPVVMARTLRVEAIYERVPDLMSSLRDEAERRMTDAPDVLARVYRDAIKPMLGAPRPTWAYLFDAFAVRERTLEPLVKSLQFLSTEDRARANDLRAIVEDKLDLDAHVSLQRALRLWLFTHIPAAMLLLGVLTVHLIAVLYL